MNFSFEKVDNVSAQLTVKVEKADYEDKVKAALKELRKKAQIPGFRAGQVPLSLLQKRAGAEVTAEEVEKLLNQSVVNYLKEQKIHTLMAPMPNVEKTEADFKTQENYTFVMDIALAPEFDATLSKDDKIPYYKIKVEDADVDQQVKAYAQRGGSYNKVDSYEENDMIKGLLAQLDEKGNTLEGGIQVEGAVMLPNYMKNKDEQAKFAGAKVNDVIVFNPAAAYKESDVELSSLLKITKEEAAEVKSDFSFQVEEITRFEPAPINQDLFDMILGKDVVKSEEEFRQKIAETMSRDFEDDANYRLVMDLRQYMEKRVGELEFNKDMVRRALKGDDDSRTDEQIEASLDANLKELTWYLIKEKLADQLGVKVEQADVIETAKMQARLQFAQYGMMNVPEDALTNYANQMLKDRQQAEGLVARTEEFKIVQAARDVVTLDTKELTLDEFNNLFKED